jgi:hypothetical protein
MPTLFLTKVPKTNNEEKTAISTNIAGRNRERKGNLKLECG